MATLEIAVTSLEEAIEAERGGADSVEVSYDLARDGLTPSFELATDIVERLSIDVHVIVRPHDCGFVYNDTEFAQILDDTQRFVGLGVAGIVYGAHCDDKSLHIEQIKQVVQAADGLPVTLHRALDSCVNPETSLNQLKGVISRVLTSGPAAYAWDGREGLRQWQAQFGDVMDFIAAGSIRLEMLPKLIMDTGVSGVHVGSAAQENGRVSSNKVHKLRQQMLGIY